MGPWHYAKFQKKVMNQSQENLRADWRMEGQKEGQTDPLLYDPIGWGQGSNNLSSASDWSEYTKSYFKENAKLFPKNSTTQENITI